MQRFNYPSVFFFSGEPWLFDSGAFVRDCGNLQSTCFMACLGDYHMFVIRVNEDAPYALWRQLADQLPRPVTDYAIRHVRLPSLKGWGRCYQVMAVLRSDVQRIMLLRKKSLCIHASYTWSRRLEAVCTQIFPKGNHTAWHAWRDDDRLYVWLIIADHVVVYRCFYGVDAECIQSLQAFVRHCDFLSVSDWYVEVESSLQSAIASCYSEADACHIELFSALLPHDTTLHTMAESVCIKAQTGSKHHSIDGWWLPWWCHYSYCFMLSMFALSFIVVLLLTGYGGYQYLMHVRAKSEVHSSVHTPHFNQQAWAVLGGILSGLDAQKMPTLSAIDGIQYKPGAITLSGYYLEERLCAVLSERFQYPWNMTQCDKKHFVLRFPLQEERG